MKQGLHNWFYVRPSAFHIGGKGPGKCQRWKSGQHSTPAELQSDHQLQPAWEMARAQGCFKMEMPSSPEIFLHLRALGSQLSVLGGNALTAPKQPLPKALLMGQDWAGCKAAALPVQCSLLPAVWAVDYPSSCGWKPCLDTAETHTCCLGAFASSLATPFCARHALLLQMQNSAF